MSALQNTPAVHRGNYYTAGAIRVLAKLAGMGIAVPDDALAVPKFEGGGEPLVQFKQIEHALLNWFEGRDYDQAQALIHYKVPCFDYHVIRILDVDACPRELSTDMLCPTRADAVAAVVFACDRDAIGIDAFRQDGDAIVAVINGVDVVKIEAIAYEPFDLGIRDRVRTALKGVREYDPMTLQARAARLPGFADFDYGDSLSFRTMHRLDTCQLLGHPSSWALAMRGALAQVDIDVKLSQAQELTAVFFGAGSWHQLVKHQDALNDGFTPIALNVKTAAGHQQRFYCTTEEALFAAGAALKAYPEPVVVQNFGLCLDKHRLTLWAAARRAIEAAGPANYCPPCIECGSNDYWSVESDGEPAHLDAAQRILQALGQANGIVSTQWVLYAGEGAAGILAALLRREGQPKEHLVQFGEHAVAVFHVPNPNGGSQLTARARIYRIDAGRPHHVADVDMYKAELDVVNDAGQTRLVIGPDYGKGEPVEILVPDMDQLGRLLELTHGDGLFARRRPHFEALAPGR